MVDFEKSLNAMEVLIMEDSKISIEENNLDTPTEGDLCIEQKNDDLHTDNIKNNEVYRLGLNRSDHAKVLLMASLMAKKFNRHIGRQLPSEKLENAFKKNKILNNALLYKLGLIGFVIILYYFHFSLESLILSLLLLMIYALALYSLIKNEKFIYKYIVAIKNSMGEELLNKQVNILELAYEVIRTKNVEINKLLKKRLKEQYKSYVKEYKKYKGIEKTKKEVRGLLTYKELIDLYSQSLHTKQFFFKIILEDIYKYRTILEKQKK